MNLENIHKISEIIEKSIDYHVESILETNADIYDFAKFNSYDLVALKELTTILNNLKGVEYLNANIDAQGAISQAMSGVDLSNMDFSKIANMMGKIGG